MAHVNLYDLNIFETAAALARFAHFLRSFSGQFKIGLNGRTERICPQDTLFGVIANFIILSTLVVLAQPLFARFLVRKIQYPALRRESGWSKRKLGAFRH